METKTNEIIQVKVEKLPKNTIKLDITVPNKEVKAAYEVVMEQVVQEVEVKGFRKGQAPKDLVQEKVDTTKVYGEVVNKLLQVFYPMALQQNQISPVSNPKVEIKEFDIEKDFVFVAQVSIRPEVKLGDFRKELKNFYTEKGERLNKEYLEEKQALEKEDSEEAKTKLTNLHKPHNHLSGQEVIDILNKTSKVEVPEIVLEEEIQRMKTRLLNHANAVKMDLNQYLTAINKTAEQLDKEYAETAEYNLRAEFVLAELIKQEKAEVTDVEIKEALTALGEPNIEERLNNIGDKYYIKSVLEKNKVVTNLIKETEGENYHEHHEHN